MAQTKRGPMKAPSKADLKLQLEQAEGRIAELEEENRQLRSGVVSAQVEAPVMFVAGITAAGTPFVEPLKPAKPSPQALDLVAAHLTRMATVALTAEQSPTERLDNLSEEVEALRYQVGEVQAGMGGIQRIVQEQNHTISEALGTAGQPPLSDDEE